MIGVAGQAQSHSVIAKQNSLEHSRRFPITSEEDSCSVAQGEFGASEEMPCKASAFSSAIDLQDSSNALDMGGRQAEALHRGEGVKRHSESEKTVASNLDSTALTMLQLQVLQTWRLRHYLTAFPTTAAAAF